MGFYGYLIGAAGLIGLAVGLCLALRSRRTLRRLDSMLTAAIDGGFSEDTFDESALSAVETKMSRFLSGCAAANRDLSAEKESIKSLIADISHQTKTPIANILLYASLLSEGDLSPAQQAQVQALSAQAEKLSFLVQALVNASRLETGILTMTPARHGVQQLLDAAAGQAAETARSKGVRLTVEETDCAVLCDGKWTAEALYNVVDNAVKYTPFGGSVRLSATALGQFCRIDVSDTGIGIPEVEQASIFQRFYRGQAVREQEGLGIGLYLTREILSGQGGFVKVSSKAGRGSTFSLYLPRG